MSIKSIFSNVMDKASSKIVEIDKLMNSELHVAGNDIDVKKEEDFYILNELVKKTEELLTLVKNFKL